MFRAVSTSASLCVRPDHCQPGPGSPPAGRVPLTHGSRQGRVGSRSASWELAPHLAEGCLAWHRREGPPDSGSLTGPLGWRPCGAAEPRKRRAGTQLAGAERGLQGRKRPGLASRWPAVLRTEGNRVPGALLLGDPGPVTWPTPPLRASPPSCRVWTGADCPVPGGGDGRTRGLGRTPKAVAWGAAGGPRSDSGHPPGPVGSSLTSLDRFPHLNRHTAPLHGTV